MGGVNIPLPALQARPPEQQNPLEQYARIQQIKGMQQQQQMQGQQLQQETMQTQQMQRDQADQQAVQQALAANPGATYGDVLPMLRGKIGPRTYATLVEADQKIKKGYSDQSKVDLENAAAQHAQYGQIYDSVMQMPDEAVAQNWPQIVQSIQAVPGNKLQLNPQQPLSKEQLTSLGPMLSLNAAYLQKEQEKRVKDAQAAKDTAQAKQATAAANKTQAEMPGGPLEAGRVTPALRYTQQQENARQANSLKAQKDKKDVEEQAIETAAQSIANGDLTRLKDIASMRGDQRLLIFNRAKQINPQFNTADVDRKIKMADSYTNGKDGQSMQSFGTFLEHAGEASDVVNNVRLSNTKLLNKPLNWWKANVSSDPAYTQFTAALEPVRKEFEGFLLGGRALYGDDRKAAETILSDNSTPAQIQAALKQMGHTVKARYNESNFRYQRVMGKPLEGVISPEAEAGAQKIGISLGGGQQAAPAASGPPAGATHTAMGSDGKRHYTNNQGQDLGVAQ